MRKVRITIEAVSRAYYGGWPDLPGEWRMDGPYMSRSAALKHAWGLPSSATPKRVIDWHMLFSSNRYVWLAPINPDSVFGRLKRTTDAEAACAILYHPGGESCRLDSYREALAGYNAWATSPAWRYSIHNATDEPWYAQVLWMRSGLPLYPTAEHAQSAAEQYCRHHQWRMVEVNTYPQPLPPPFA